MKKKDRFTLCIFVTFLVLVVFSKIYSIQTAYLSSLCENFSVHDLVDKRAHGSIYYIDEHCPHRLFEANERGHTAFAHSIIRDDRELAGFLSRRAAKVHLLDNCGESYLHLAACRGNAQLVNILIDNYAHHIDDVSVCSNLTARSCAEQEGHRSVLFEFDQHELFQIEERL